MAEIEFSILSRQCLEHRIPDRETLRQEVAKWVTQYLSKAMAFYH